MKKLYLGLLIIFILSVTPALAATKTVAPKSKAPWKPLAPTGYTPITWAKAPGIASFFKAQDNGGAIDFVTRIYLPQNQIGFIVSTTTPLNLSLTSPDISSTTTTAFEQISNLSTSPNLSFPRFGAEATKAINPAVKFLWNAPFFNMKPTFSDLSMAVKYSLATSTVISSGARSVPDMAQERRMLIINNQTAQATIDTFDSDKFIDVKNGDQALEGFAPTVAKSDGSSGASRLFLGVTDNNQELVVYCSQLATVAEASQALTEAGISPDHQLQADGGGSASCGYNLPGQFFVEPTRTLPLLMGAETILMRGTITTKDTNVRTGPATKNPIKLKLPKGLTVKVFEEKNGWYRIGPNEWVIKSLIKQSS